MAFPELNNAMLVAAPVLRDAIFKQSVILMSEHSAEGGAVGYVVNRPMGKVTSDLLQDNIDPGLADVPVYVGGPVGTDSLTFASLRWSFKRRTVVMETQLKMAEAAHQRALGRVVRAFVGYSGWARGQLERELRQRSWIVTTPSLLVVDYEPSSSLWADVLTDMGPAFAMLARIPDRPDKN
jgi:putative transcriptional regulator